MNIIKIFIFIFFLISFIVLLFKYVLLNKKFKSVLQKNEEINKSENINFINSVVHDLKAPTLAQIQALNLLLNNSFGKLSKKQISIVLEIKESCEYMHNLILTILHSYLYENGKIKLQLSKFNFNELLNEITSGLIPLLEEKKLKIIINSELSNEFIIADKLQIKRVLLNLISNAIDYSNNETEITLSIRIKDEKLLFDIQNFSHFIDADFLKHVYQKFYSSTSKSYRKISTGLGLYIVKQIITAHNGEVYAKKSEDGVYNFGFYLPIDEIPAFNKKISVQ